MRCCQRRAPLRPDPHSVARRLPGTIKSYQRCVALFVSWCISFGVAPQDAEQLDDLLVEWKNAAHISKSQFAAAIVGVELTLPRVKGELKWARSVLSAWDVASVIHHHKPMPWFIALLCAMSLAWLGFARLGAGMLIQQCRGLRPSEMLQLLSDAVVEVQPGAFGPDPVFVINLGQKQGTKSKRPQSVIINARKHPLAFDLIAVLKVFTPAGQPLVGAIDVQMYQKLLAWICAALGIEGYSLHSSRAGFASHGLLSGTDFVTLREEGRWLSDSPLRVYLDLVSTAAQAAHSDINNWFAVIDELRTHFCDIFPWWLQSQRRPCRPLPGVLLARLLAAWTKTPLIGKFRRRCFPPGTRPRKTLQGIARR